jgi:hypothetical protein
MGFMIGVVEYCGVLLLNGWGVPLSLCVFKKLCVMDLSISSKNIIY